MHTHTHARLHTVNSWKDIINWKRDTLCYSQPASQSLLPATPKPLSFPGTTHTLLNHTQVTDNPQCYTHTDQAQLVQAQLVQAQLVQAHARMCGYMRSHHVQVQPWEHKNNRDREERKEGERQGRRGGEVHTNADSIIYRLTSFLSYYHITVHTYSLTLLIIYCTPTDITCCKTSSLLNMLYFIVKFLLFLLHSYHLLLSLPPSPSLPPSLPPFLPHLPALVIIISVVDLWNLAQRSRPCRVTFMPDGESDSAVFE